MSKITKTYRRAQRIRKKIRRVGHVPRLSIFRSNRFLYAQIIDDIKKNTIVGLSEKKSPVKESSISGEKRIERAKNLGLSLAKQALTKKVKKVVFDKGRYTYHGIVKAFADGAREGGLEF